MSATPILYSFRRCPYAMRARMALMVSNTPVRLREVVLREKPEAMLALSSKATVPVMVLENGEVLDESLDIMLWALSRNDPENWLAERKAALALIQQSDEGFKYHLDRYKYPSRYADVDPLEHRAAGREFLKQLEAKISLGDQLLGENPGLADYAIFPFVRQFANHDRGWFDAQKLAAVQNWLAGHLGSALFASIMQKYPQWHIGDEEPVFGSQHDL